jgi:hypothetical protein
MALTATAYEFGEKLRKDPEAGKKYLDTYV